MFRPSYRQFSFGAFALISAYPQICLAEAQNNQNSSSASGPSVSTVSLYLSDVSREQLKKYLESVGKVNLEPKQIVIKRLSNPNDSFTYEPLFGERAAFRLKAIVTTKDGRTAGIGRVSIMSGEVKDSEYDASLILESPSASIHNVVESMDLPTRITNSGLNGYQSKNFWKGRIPSAKVLDASYPAIPASIVLYPFSNQIVVDGQLCSSNHVDSHGKCAFDRSLIVAVHDSPADHANASPSASPNPVVVDDDDKESHGNKRDELQHEFAVEEEKAECPLCRFMKSGPCKDQFLEWDSCINKLGEDGDLSECLGPTMNMMRCMRNFEYYDLMTAGTGDKWAAAEAARAEAEKNALENAKQQEQAQTSTSTTTATASSAAIPK